MNPHTKITNFSNKVGIEDDVAGSEITMDVFQGGQIMESTATTQNQMLQMSTREQRQAARLLVSRGYMR